MLSIRVRCAEHADTPRDMPPRNMFCAPDSAKAVSARKKGITVVNEAWFNRALQGRGATGKGKPAGRSGVAPMEVDDNDGDDAEDVAAEQDDQPADDEEAGGGGGGGDGGGDGDGGGAEPVPLNSLPEGAVHKIEGKVFLLPAQWMLHVL